ncbi:hypothetical protein SLE2022_080570 [Rubroshorea leprosula]
MAPDIKDCHHQHCCERKKLLRKILTFILIAFLLILITILIIWAILRPTKPTFILQDVTVSVFNASTPNLLTTNFQVTIKSGNPNDRTGIYYDKLDIYATYHGQQVTLPTAIPPTFQGSNEVNVWSPLICGTDVPIAPFNSVLLNQEQSSGGVTLLIKADGRVRWKVGSFTSGRYHLYVRCPAFISFGSGSTGIIISENVVKYQMATRCTVSV